MDPHGDGEAEDDVEVAPLEAAQVFLKKGVGIIVGQVEVQKWNPFNFFFILRELKSECYWMIN